MQGRVDSTGRCLIPVLVRATAHLAPATIECWIDTGFTGELALPRAEISNLGLSQSANVQAELADGSPVTLAAYACLVDWFGEEKTVQAVGTGGSDTLLGVGLLRDHILIVDYRAQTVVVQ